MKAQQMTHRDMSQIEKWIPGICKDLYAGPKMVLISMGYEIEV